MAEFNIGEVTAATSGTPHVGSVVTFHGVSTDTRTLKPGNIFIALVGEKFDGHDYIDAAVEKGAACVIIGRKMRIPSGVSAVMVADTKKALQDLARFHRNRFSIPIVGITGSNGKTTTKDMTAAVLSAKFITLKTEANFNNEIGLPQTLLRLNSSHQAAVVEMGMRGKGEISELTSIALPTMGVVTTVGETHIELLGSVENIASAKAELVESIGEEGVVILNADNRHVRDMADRTKAKAIYFGLQNADVRAANIVTADLGLSFECYCFGQCFKVKLGTYGKHNVYNALAAIAVGHELGLNPNEICRGIAAFKPDSMRLHVETRGSFRIINDVYNASPLSMAASIDALKDIASGRTVAVLGDMLELGEFAVDAHRKIGDKLIEKRIDVVVTVGELAAEIAKTAAAGVGAFSCGSHDEARSVLLKVLQPGDTILFKGSRGMKMEKLLDIFA